MLATSIYSHTTQDLLRKRPRRLRESCEPCSAAKVRCSKDKPVCARCTERDLPCVYFATRRSGRPPNKVSSDGTTTSRNHDSVHTPVCQTSTGPETWQMQNCSPTLFPTDTVNFPELVHTAQTSPGLETDSSSSLSLNIPEWSSRDLDDFFAAFFSESSLDKLPPIPEDVLQADSISRLETTSSPPESSPHDSITDCNCLTTALGLLSKSDTSTYTGFGPEKQSFSPTESLISENESVAISVDNILQCSYAQDSQVLILLALVVSKVLDGYLRAARVAPGAIQPQSSRSSSAFTCPLSTEMANAYVHGEDSLRTAGQLVLGELHRALKLVNGLATRLNECGSYRSSPDWMRRSSSAGLSPTGFDKSGAVSFSSAIMDQLGMDLRRQLKSVVATITRMLQGAA